jgi:hypothetical protein
MARKKNSRTYAKKSKAEDPSYKVYKPDYYPVQRYFQTGAISAGPYVPGTWFVDFARGLSEINHRLYRRSRCYTLKIDVDNDAAMDGNTVDVYVLANTWYVANAVASARAAVETARSEEMALVGSKQLARWNDFIPSNGFATQIAGCFAAASPGTQTARDNGEHVITVITDAGGNNKTFTLSGTSGLNAYNIFEEYDDAGDPITTPDSTQSGAYAELKADVGAGELTRIQNDGNRPPYSDGFHGAFGNILVKVATLSVGGTGSQRLSTGFFEAPLGYVWLDGLGATYPDGKITMTAKGGNYKGVHAPSMAEG